MISADKQPIEAAHFLARQPINQGYLFEALHEYHDRDGRALYWRIRLKQPETGDKWIRPMYISQDNYVLREPLYVEAKPLYRLYELVSRPNEVVVICEGEWCADALAKYSILATTSGSADSAEKADWLPLAGRTVIIWPDNDPAGQRYTDNVTKILQALGCVIQLIDINTINLPNKGDAVDWLVLNPQATKADILALPTKAPIVTTGFEQNESLSDDTDNDEHQSQASMLVTFVNERMELFHDKNGNVYTQDRITQETRRLDSRLFKDWLLAGFYNATGKAVRDQSIREALSTLGGLARFNGECHEVYIRVAQYEDSYYLDLAEPRTSRVVQMNARGWTIINDAPVRFLRPETLHTLPEPISGGDLTELWQLTNIPAHAQLLCIAWLADCLRPDTPFPLLELIGEQGSAKSTTQEILRRLIDPNACNLRAVAKSPEDIFVSAGVNWLVSYENISHLSPGMQDALCILSTGGGLAKRKLYSDADESVIQVKRPVILNGISVSVTAQDLIDRSVSIELPMITNRNETTNLWRNFDAKHSQLLGALLDIFSKALSQLPTVKTPTENCPRLIEFTRLGMAIAEAMDKSGDDFLLEFTACRQESIARTIDASPVASALIEWFEKSGRRSQQLPLNELFRLVERHKSNNTDAWPRSAKGFADALRRIAPALRQMDIECRSLGKIGSYVSWLVKPRE